MESIKKYSYIILTKKLSGQYVRFTSDCEFFPNFDVNGKIIGTSMKGTELVFRLRTASGKIISVGSNMRNLRFQIIKNEKH